MSGKTRILCFLMCCVFGISIVSFSSQASREPQSEREVAIHDIVLRQIKTFHSYITDSLLSEVQKKKIDEKRLRHAFLTSRLLFKQFEWASEYFAADLSKRINGPPVQEIENADLLDPSLARGIDPMGLQVIEESIFPKYQKRNRGKLKTEIGYLVHNTQYLISFFETHDLADWRILDGVKLEVFRVITLGITGFDNPLSLNSMQESSVALKSLKAVLRFYTDPRDKTSATTDIDSAVAYLRHHLDFDSFDRALFITKYANPLSTKIEKLRAALPGYAVKYNRMLRQDAKTLFDTGVFNVNAFTPGPGYEMTDDRVKLGKKLFFDASLSGPGTRSCATCHKPELALTDGVDINTDINDPQKKIARNTPTLIDAALQSNYFYDMRALTLEDQARDVIQNPHEMDGSIENIIRYVTNDSAYRSMFSQAYPNGQDGKITADEVTNALASFTRGETKLNSRFDDFMRGNPAALTPKELRGFNLFTGKAKCATCHYLPLFNGMTPPKYVESDAEVIGVPKSLTDSTIDADVGYYGVIGVESYKYAFKTPTVRNIDKTAPYMHNGIYNTLEEVMDFYNNGGAAGLGIHLPNQTLPEQPLRLTEEEKEDIIAFMKSLDSR